MIKILVSWFLSLFGTQNGPTVMPGRLSVIDLLTLLNSGKVVVMKDAERLAKYPTRVSDRILNLPDDEVRDFVASKTEVLVAVAPIPYKVVRFRNGRNVVLDNVILDIVHGLRSTTSFVMLSEPNDYQIWLLVHLYQPLKGSAHLEVEVFGRNINPEPIDRTLDDGRCSECEGWGCWTCNFSGGY